MLTKLLILVNHYVETLLKKYSYKLILHNTIQQNMRFPVFYDIVLKTGWFFYYFKQCILVFSLKNLCNVPSLYFFPIFSKKSLFVFHVLHVFNKKRFSFWKRKLCVKNTDFFSLLLLLLHMHIFILYLVFFMIILIFYVSFILGSLCYFRI